MDNIERLAQQAAEAINGGEFNDGKWYTEGQRQAWRKAMTPAADEIERLRGIINDDRLEGAADEIERLREELSANDLIDEIAYGKMIEAADEIERLRDELKFADEIRQSALQSLFGAEKEIERLRQRNAVLQTELALVRTMLPNVKVYQTGTGDFTPLEEKE